MVNVFISSTCKDLEDKRNKIKSLTKENINYILSDHDGIYYPHDTHTYEACLQAVKDADILIYIVGFRFGGEIDDRQKEIINLSKLEKSTNNTKAKKIFSSKISITMAEVFYAINLNKPVYVMQDKKITDYILNPKKNWSQDFTSIEEKESIINMINFLSRREVGNGLITFNNENFEERFSTLIDRYLNHVPSIRYEEFQEGEKNSKFDMLFQPKGVYTVQLISHIKSDRNITEFDFIYPQKIYLLLKNFKELRDNYEEKIKSYESGIDLISIINTIEYTEKFLTEFPEKIKHIVINLSQCTMGHHVLSDESITNILSRYIASKLTQTIVTLANYQPREDKIIISQINGHSIDTLKQPENYLACIEGCQSDDIIPYKIGSISNNEIRTERKILTPKSQGKVDYWYYFDWMTRPNKNSYFPPISFIENYFYPQLLDNFFPDAGNYECGCRLDHMSNDSAFEAYRNYLHLVREELD